MNDLTPHRWGTLGPTSTILYPCGHARTGPVARHPLTCPCQEAPAMNVGHTTPARTVTPTPRVDAILAYHADRLARLGAERVAAEAYDASLWWEDEA